MNLIISSGFTPYAIMSVYRVKSMPWEPTFIDLLGLGNLPVTGQYYTANFSHSEKHCLRRARFVL